MTVLGIDLSADERRDSGVCILRGKRVRTLLLGTDDELLALARKVRPQIVAIDAPLSLPPGRKSIHERTEGHFRPCDIELLKRGIPFFPITLGGMRKLTERGMRLKALLEGEGFRVAEVFPGGAQDVLGLPRKQHDLNGLREGLRRLDLHGIRDDATHDELDAVTAAYVGWLFLRGEAEVLGDEQGGIVMPKPLERHFATTNYPPEFLDGLRLYWRGYYWHAHEAWEELWRKSSEPLRSFLKALIQIAAALIHSGRGDWRGVNNLLTRVQNYLARCPDKLLGIDVPMLRQQMAAFQAETMALLRGRKARFNWRVKPRIVPDGITPPKRERCRRAPHDLPAKVKERM